MALEEFTGLNERPCLTVQRQMTIRNHRFRTQFRMPCEESNLGGSENGVNAGAIRASAKQASA